MTSEKRKKLKRSRARHSEYYDMMDVFDRLHQDSKNNQTFTGLMKYITSPENIQLAFRNIKRNNGSVTSGVDKQTISDLEKIPVERFVQIVQDKFQWYKPKPVKRVEIPKPNGKKRPLGIPTMLDRIIQQCILQVLEPICEAKFHERSNGFRPLRSAENAIAQCYRMIQIQHLHYVVDIDIEGFFDNVNHSKLKRQIWQMGIQDKKLLCIISEMLKAPIVMPNGKRVYPSKGTPQGGILSPLLSNIVLNEFDWWIASQWETIPTQKQYTSKYDNGTDRGHTYRELRKSRLKEVYVVRYADDFKLFCKNRESAEKIYQAAKMWLLERLKLQISEEKSKIVNLKNCNSEFLGFEMKAVRKGKKFVVRSHMCNKAIQKSKIQLKEQIKVIQRPKSHKDEYLQISRYNSKVIGLQNYYCLATHISADCSAIEKAVYPMLKNRLRKRIKRNGHLKNPFHIKRYGSSKQMYYVSQHPLLPIAYVQTKWPSYKRNGTNIYSSEGRDDIHKALKINMDILHRLMRSTIVNRSIEYMDNRISLYAAQYGKCAITCKVLEFDEIHCHHIIPLHLNGTDRYQNLVIMHKDIHILLHATQPETILAYINRLGIDKKMLKKLNQYRMALNLSTIEN